jgi:hypothetical protein
MVSRENRVRAREDNRVLDHQNQGTFEAHKRRKAQIRHKSPACKSFVFSVGACKVLKNSTVSSRSA